MNWINKTLKSAGKLASQKKKQRQFLWLGAAIISGIFGVGFYHETANYYLLIPIGACVLLSVLFPKISQPFLYVWMMFGLIMSSIVSPILLAIIFVVGIIPTSLFVKKNYKNGWVKSDQKHSFDEQF